MAKESTLLSSLSVKVCLLVLSGYHRKCIHPLQLFEPHPFRPKVGHFHTLSIVHIASPTKQQSKPKIGLQKDKLSTNSQDFSAKEIKDMAPEVVLQLAFLIPTLSIFFVMIKLPKQALTKLRAKNRANLQSSRHFVQGSHLLVRARSIPNREQSLIHAKNALIEAEKALSLSPKDPAPHILKALALDLMDRKNSALRSLDLALSIPCVKSLSEKERGDALVKRAELKMAVNRKRRIDSAMEDLVESVRLLSDGGSGTESKGLCLLGQCYEWKGMREMAREAFEKALRLEPESIAAREGLDRLAS